MLTSDEIFQSEIGAVTGDFQELPGGEWNELLQQGFGTQFTILDAESGEVVCASPDQPDRDWDAAVELCREVARRGRPEFIADEDPLIVLALPLATAENESLVAVAAFLTREIIAAEELSLPARLLGMQPEEAFAWAGRQTPWTPEMLQRVGALVLKQSGLKRRVKELEDENGSLSVHLAGTYEEISLLYRLTQNLRISESDEALGRVALEWMEEVLPARGLAIQLVPVAAEDESLSPHARTEPVLLSHGDCPLENGQFTDLIGHLGAELGSRPIVVNRPITDGADWPFEEVRQVIAVSLDEGENLFGWLVALNHVDDDEFGTVEASLLSSVAAILGIHGGNIELYRQQSELMAGIVRALTSAIDAKDPYTCGHSDRVAQVAVRLAEDLGCDSKTLSTMYLSGLLHDIGKIGIDDSVLRKPGKLSDSEYEHIKRHVEIGHKILLDLGRLDEVLPVILHHHESWDGSGYPHNLDEKNIPLPARIVAVADAFDAMSSDRPYRKGMRDARIDEIFRSGSGQQWDPQVVDAFFRLRDELRGIAKETQEKVELDLHQWT